jgi:hypothetical protein
MTELSGTLEGVGLTAIVRFLIGLKKSGCLQLRQQDWSGQIFFTEGQVAGAALGTRTGLSALDALVETLPAATFVFDSQVSLPGEPTLRLSPDALQAHLDELTARLEQGVRKLPPADAVPVVVLHDEEAEEPVPLDRAMLQTLLLVDGQRSVRQVVAQRGSFDALWHMATLTEMGLIRLDSAPAVVQPTPSPVVIQPTPLTFVHPPVSVPATPEPLYAPAAPRLATESVADAQQAAAPAAHCPKLGFNDDASSSFSRPTRLHRCFAAGAPLPLSLDQQRELCLSDQFSTCPRLQEAVHGPGKNGNGRWNGVARTMPTVASGAPQPNAAHSPMSVDAEDPRIVRLPFAARGAAANREAVASASGAVDSPVARPSNTAPADGVDARPTPLRARLERIVGYASSDSTVVEPSPASSYAYSATGTTQQRPVTEQAPREPLRTRVLDESPADEPPLSPASGAPVERRIFKIPVGMIATGAAVLIVIAIVGYLIAPQTSTLFDDNTIDPSVLPNTSLLAQGTPVSALNLPRATAVPTAAQPTSAAAQPTTAAAQPVSGAGSGPNAPAEPAPGDAGTNAAAAVPANAQPATGAIGPNGAAAAPASARSASSTSLNAQVANAQPTLSVPTTLVDEHFQSNDANWPSNPRGVAWITNGIYRVATRQAGQFIAIGAPIPSVPSDVVVTAGFRKLAGPAGGGYGIIVRDQAAAQHDGTSQDGRYYVLEAGDRGEVGIWRRESDHWVDLLTWQHADAVKPGNAANELTVRAVGKTLTLSVNGTQVATKTDATLSGGGVGVFVGGDGNQVALDHFTVQTP